MEQYALSARVTPLDCCAWESGAMGRRTLLYISDFIGTSVSKRLRLVPCRLTALLDDDMSTWAVRISEGHSLAIWTYTSVYEPR